MGVAVGFAAYPATLLIAEIGRSADVGLVGLGERLLRVVEHSALLIISTGFAATFVMGLTGVVLALLLGVPGGARTKASNRRVRPWAWMSLGVVMVLAAIFAILTILPLDTSGLDAVPPSAPAQSYPHALELVAAVRADEMALGLHDKCGSTALTHGEQTTIAVVYLHGLTSCPAQVDQLATEIFNLGYNVYIPRLPGHGMADRMTTALAETTAEEFLHAVNGAVDIAHGLGESVVVTGLSGGGTMAVWLVQNRSDIDRVVALAPFLAPFGLPSWAGRAAANLLLIIPVRRQNIWHTSRRRLAECG
ncbi:alpha/beta hydrolase, partial [Pelagibacterium mangrovi]|uniref:alpha/beta hydrolase n=1 Tax=Pelagibacterium mangrovi TaxID=3119828 RepID=UPI002FCA8F5C